MALPIELSAILRFDARQAINAMGQSAVSFKRLQSQANRVGSGLKTFGGGVGKAALAFTPLTLGMGLAVSKANEFERGIYEVSTIADEAELPISKIDSTAINLAKTFATSPVEQTKAMYNAVSFGASTAAEATDRLVQANKLAIGGVTETNTALELLSGAMNVYGASGQTAADANDIFFTAVRKGKTTIGELSASMGQVMPTASALGIGLADLGTALATVTLANINTAEASTALNAAFANVIKPSKDAREVSEKLGIEFTATALKAKGLVPFMADITKKAGGNIDAMAALFGSVRGVKSMLALTANEGAIFTDVLKAMEGRSGAADAAFKRMTESVDFQMRKIKALGVTGLTVFGQVLQDALVRLLSPLADVAEGFVDIMQAVKTGDIEIEKLGKTGAAVARGIKAGIEDVRKTFDALLKSFSKASKKFNETFGPEGVQKITEFTTAVTIFGAAFSPVLLGLAGLGFVIAQLKPIIFGLGAVFSGVFGVISSLTAPIILLIGLIGLAFYGLRKQISDVFSGIWEVLSGPVWEDMKKIFADTYKEISRIFSLISAAFKEVTDTMGVDFKEVGRVIGTVLGGVLVEFVKVVAYFAIGVAQVIGGFVALGIALGEWSAKFFQVVLDPMRAFAKFVIWIREDVMGKKVSKSFRDYAYANTPPNFERSKTRGIQAPPRIDKVKASEAYLLAAEKGFAVAKQTPKELYLGAEERGLRLQSKSGGVAKEVRDLASERSEALYKEREDYYNTANKTADAAASAADSAKSAALSAESAAEAARKKPCAEVKIDGREVARSNAKANDEIRARSGAKATPWQRRQVLEYGATPA